MYRIAAYKKASAKGTNHYHVGGALKSGHGHGETMTLLKMGGGSPRRRDSSTSQLSLH